MSKCDCSTQTTSKNWFNSLSLLNRVLLLLALLGAMIALYIYAKPFSNWFTFVFLSLPSTSLFGSALAFFLYDVPKVFLLLITIIFIVGLIRSFITPEKTRKLLHQKSLLAGHAVASVLGIVSPFCTCSTIPLFIGFVESGIPLGITFSFLISSPLIDEVALALLMGLFGWKVAGLYLASGLLISFFAGLLIGKLNPEKELEDWVQELRANNETPENLINMNWSDRFQFAMQSVKDIVSKVWVYILGGIIIGSFIHGYVPEAILANIMGEKAWWSVPVAVLIGIPIYSNCAGIIPVIEALLGKGVALGTVISFMMAVIGLSLPEGLILRKILKPKLLALFFSIVGISIIITGFLFNLII